MIIGLVYVVKVVFDGYIFFMLVVGVIINVMIKLCMFYEEGDLVFVVMMVVSFLVIVVLVDLFICDFKGLIVVL